MRRIRPADVGRAPPESTLGQAAGVGQNRRNQIKESPMPSFMMLLHGPADRPRQTVSNPQEFTRMTREYMEWADRLRERGQLKGGNKLIDEAGRILRTQNGRLSTTD